MADARSTEVIQIVSYIKRNPALSLEQFHQHWGKVHAPKVIPWAEKHGILRYQQIHTTGSIVPVPATKSAPNAINHGELPTTPVEFDGIAIFLVPSLLQFNAAFDDPYYVGVIEIDERVMLDKNGPGSGVIASFSGKMVEMMHHGQSAIDERGKEEFRELWEEWEKKTKSRA